MAKVIKYQKMDRLTVATLLKTRDKVKVCKPGQTVVNMMANGKMIKCTGLVY